MGAKKIKSEQKGPKPKKKQSSDTQNYPIFKEKANAHTETLLGGDLVCVGNQVVQSSRGEGWKNNTKQKEGISATQPRNYHRANLQKQRGSHVPRHQQQGRRVWEKKIKNKKEGGTKLAQKKKIAEELHMKRTNRAEKKGAKNRNSTEWYTPT